jgi:hypothetical protein
MCLLFLTKRKLTPKNFAAIIQFCLFFAIFKVLFSATVSKMAKEAKSEKKATPKKAKESTPKKGNGDTPKRPLSGWMLFCKEQRPVLVSRFY